MTSYIVVFGLIVVVVLVVVLVALGLRASRAGRDDDDWMDDEQPQPQPQPQSRGRRAAPPQGEMPGVPEDAYGADPGYEGASYGPGAAEQGLDRRVAGGPLAAPTHAAHAAPPPPAPSGQASDEMEDDDYWATITFDKPKFPWQHDGQQERPDVDMPGDPLAAQGAHAEQHQPSHAAVEPPGLTQPVPMGADLNALSGLGGPGSTGPGASGSGMSSGPQPVGAAPASYQPGPSPFGGDPGATANDGFPTDLGAHGHPGGGQQSPFGAPAGPGGTGVLGGVPDQPLYGGQEQQPAYGSAEPQSPYGGAPEQPYGGAPDQQPYGGGGPADQTSYLGQDQSGFGGDPSPYGSSEPSYGSTPEPSSYGAPEPSYGAPEVPSYGDYGSGDPLGGRPAAAAGPPPGARQDGYDMPLSPPPPPPSDPRTSDPRVSDPLGLPLGRTEEPAARGYADGAAPGMPAQGGGSPSDTDNHKLPTVDELLQRIQTDRQRSTGGGPGGGPGSGGGSLNDPLGDPLSTGSFGAGSGSGTGPWAPPPSSGASPGQGYDADPAGATTNLGGMAGSSGYGSPGQGPANDGYPTSPAYGESPRYDDPLSGGRDSYGSYGGEPGPGAGLSPAPGDPGRYGDFSGSSYNGGGDPLGTDTGPGPGATGAPGGGYDPNVTQAYGSGYLNQQQGGYQGNQAPGGDTGGYSTGGYPGSDPRRQQPDDWENHRDYRR